MIILMAAISKNNVIGKNGRMPWHIPEELQFFKEKTWNQNILMGRKTWENIPSNLENRNVYVLTHHEANIHKQGYVKIYTDIDDIVKTWQATDEKLIICGGAEIYKQFLPYADELWISHIPKCYIGDTYFPEFDKNCYSIKEYQNKNQFQFSCYVKK